MAGYKKSIQEITQKTLHTPFIATLQQNPIKHIGVFSVLFLMLAASSLACRTPKPRTNTAKPEIPLTPPSPDPTPPNEPRPGFALAFTADGTLGARLRGEELSLFDLSSDTPKSQTFSLKVGEAQALAFTEKLAVFGYPDGKIALWDLDAKTQTKTFQENSSGIRTLLLEQNGTKLFSGNQEGHIHVWDISTGNLLFTLKGHTATITALSQAKSFLLSGSRDSTLKIWNVKTGKLLRTLTGHSRAIWDAVLSLEGQYIISASEDGSAKGWEASTGRELFTRVESIRALAIRPDGKRVLVVRPKGLAIWEFSTGIEVAYLSTKLNLPQLVSFSLPSTFAFLFDEKGELQVFSLPSETFPEPF